MEATMDSEKQQLIETYLEPLASPMEEKDSDSDFSDAAFSVDPDWLCQETTNMSRTEKDVKRVARKKLFVACAISLIFMAGEMIGGYAAHSLAIMTDAAHLLTDFGSIVISLLSLVISSRPQSETMTFGWHRAEILGMFLSVVSIWAVTVILVLSAVQRIAEGDYDIDSRLMLLTSGCAVVANIFMVVILHQSGASHDHSHRIPTRRERKDQSSASVKAAFIHVLGDLLQSVGVLAAATIIHFWPEYKVADPICTFLFSALVIGTTLPIAKDVLRILMEGAPQGISSSAVRQLLLSVGRVGAVRSLHMWSLNTNHHLLSAHITIDEDADSQIVLRKATKLLRSTFGFTSVTIQVEKCSISAVGAKPVRRWFENNERIKVNLTSSSPKHSEIQHLWDVFKSCQGIRYTDFTSDASGRVSSSVYTEDEIKYRIREMKHNQHVENINALKQTNLPTPYHMSLRGAVLMDRFVFSTSCRLTHKKLQDS